MSQAQKKALTNYRRRLKGRGLVRLEVKVRKTDAPLVREVVNALADPNMETQARAFLRQKFNPPTVMNFKDYLAAAPLDGIDLTREPDFGRDVDL
ncbi:MAG: hypothetical protein SFV19_18805 [Rhodospirillaceae bacterium]|nr:hypothetical protein [Rhodospirillaceae bacterium]